MKNGWFSDKRDHYISSYDITNPNPKLEERKFTKTKNVNFDVVIIGMICVITFTIIVISKLQGVI